LYALATHNSTNTTYDEEHDVVQHLGKGLVHGCHGFERLGHISQAIKHERHDASQDDCHHNNDEAPDADFKFFSGQKTRLVLVLVEQFASPKQGLRGNLDSPV